MTDKEIEDHMRWLDAKVKSGEIIPKRTEGTAEELLNKFYSLKEQP